MRILHTMLRVGDLQRSIDFYTGVLGMQLLRRSDNPAHKYTLAFVGYDDEATGAVLELTYNCGVDKYDVGSGFGHVALAVDDAAAACAAIRAKGGKVTREAGPVKGGTTVIAFVEDPDGYKIELIEARRDAARGHRLRRRPQQFAQVVREHVGALAVADVEAQPALRIEDVGARRMIHRVACRAWFPAASGR